MSKAVRCEKHDYVHYYKHKCWLCLEEELDALKERLTPVLVEQAELKPKSECQIIEELQWERAALIGRNEVLEKQNIAFRQLLKELLQ